MQTQKTNAAPLTGGLLTDTGPKVGARNIQTEGGDLFAAELERASGGDGVEARRARRAAGERRRAGQAGRAEVADQARSEARQGRLESEQTGKRRRGERLEAGEAAAVAGNAPQPQPIARPEPVQIRELQSQALDPEATARTATRATEQAEPEPSGAEAPGLAGALAFAASLGESAARAEAAARIHTPPAQAAGKAARVQAAAESMPQTNTGGKPQGQAGERIARPAPEAPADKLGELLLEREAELDRQASVLRQLKAQLGPSAREISLQLSPASLGEIKLRLALRSGRLTATLRATTTEALDAIENQLPELTASLEAQGFEVVDFDLGLMKPTESAL